MVQRTDTHQHGIGSNPFSSMFGQIGHLQRMLESTRGLFLQVLEQLVVGIRQIPEAGIGDKTEDLFKQEDERQQYDHQHGMDGQIREADRLESIG